MRQRRPPVTGDGAVAEAGIRTTDGGWAGRRGRGRGGRLKLPRFASTRKIGKE